MALCHAFTHEPDTALRIHPRFFFMVACSDFKAECSSDKSRRRVSSSRAGRNEQGEFPNTE